MSPISSWEPSELDKQTQIAQQATARIAELEAENAELRKQSEILATTRRLVEAGLTESNGMYKAAMALWEAEIEGRRKAKAELAVAIELVTMARQTFDADGNGTRFLGEIREDVLKDVKRLAERGTP